jgi:hypothetical protein
VVSSFEYRFPTERGGNEIIAYSAVELLSVHAIVGTLIDHVRDGDFIPTTDSDDCGLCNYQDICRASRVGFATTSPRAEWAKEHAERLPEYVAMLARRAAGATP